MMQNNVEKFYTLFLGHITGLICISVLCLFVVGLAACVKERPVEVTAAAGGETAREEQPALQTPAAPSPRALASLKLTDQGRRHIEAGEADSAIRVLEQAISLNPRNGQNYYYLSEAWMMKGFADKAGQFNRLAESHLAGNRDWMKLVARQAERIARLEEKIKKSR